MNHTLRMLEVRRQERARLAAVERVEIPAPKQTATPMTGDEPGFPGGVKALLNIAKANGWWTRATFAIGPRIGADGNVLHPDCLSVSLAMAGPNGERLVAAYRWTGKKWEGEKPGPTRDYRTGELYNVDRTKQILRGG